MRNPEKGVERLVVPRRAVEHRASESRKGSWKPQDLPPDLFSSLRKNPEKGVERSAIALFPLNYLLRIPKRELKVFFSWICLNIWSRIPKRELKGQTGLVLQLQVASQESRKGSWKLNNLDVKIVSFRNPEKGVESRSRNSLENRSWTQNPEKGVERRVVGRLEVAVS